MADSIGPDIKIAASNISQPVTAQTTGSTVPSNLGLPTSSDVTETNLKALMAFYGCPSSIKTAVQSQDAFQTNVTFPKSEKIPDEETTSAMIYSAACLESAGDNLLLFPLAGVYVLLAIFTFLYGLASEEDALETFKLAMEGEEGLKRPTLSEKQIAGKLEQDKKAVLEHLSKAFNEDNLIWFSPNSIGASCNLSEEQLKLCLDSLMKEDKILKSESGEYVALATVDARKSKEKDQKAKEAVKKITERLTQPAEGGEKTQAVVKTKKPVSKELEQNKVKLMDFLKKEKLRSFSAFGLSTRPDVVLTYKQIEEAAKSLYVDGVITQDKNQPHIYHIPRQ